MASIIATPGEADDLGEPDARERRVQCDGPAEEIALLGAICSSTSHTGYLYLDQDDGSTGVGVSLPDRWEVSSGARLLLYGLVDVPSRDWTDDRSASMTYAAYVLLDPSDIEADDPLLAHWGDAEPITEGTVVTEVATGDPCGFGWTGSAELLWRNTTIRVSWEGSHGC